MSEMKRPQEVETYMVGGLRKSVYLKADADAYISAMERRARIAWRIIGKLVDVNSETSHELFHEAEREIDSEKGEQR